MAKKILAALLVLLFLGAGESLVLIDGFFSRSSMLTALTSDLQTDTVQLKEQIESYYIGHCRVQKA